MHVRARTRTPTAIWLHDAYEQFMLLVGKAAPIEMQQLITYICLTYHPSILGIDTVRVYHSGPKLLAEIDIVMDPDETLRVTHDVSQSLQDELEKLPDVERAFVHVDWETEHKPEHSSKVTDQAPTSVSNSPTSLAR